MKWTTTTNAAELTRLECLDKPGHQWEYSICLKSTPGDNKALCIATGDQWYDGTCLHANVSAPPTTVPWYQASTQAQTQDGGNLWLWDIAVYAKDSSEGGSCIEGTGVPLGG